MPSRMRSAGVAAVLATTMATGFVIPAASAAVRGPDFAGREVFKIVGRVPGPRYPVAYAWGAFKATGYFVRKRATLVFPKGRIAVRRHVTQTTYYGPDLKTCRFKIVRKGSFVVTRGTGRYRGLRESGRFVTTLHGQLRQTGHDRCGAKVVSRRTVTYEIGRAS
jgi:hypothetical protein